MMYDVARDHSLLFYEYRPTTTEEKIRKNIYLHIVASLVALGYFRNVHLSFLIVGHTHEDIDQRFSIISDVLKRQDIDSVKEMLALIERGASSTEAFTSALLMEHI